MNVVVVDPRRPSLIPIEALTLLVGDVQYTEELSVTVASWLPAARPAQLGVDAPVLVTSDPRHPAVIARLAAGATVLAGPAAPRGERLLDAVAIMDTLRTVGPWEGKQTHHSLCCYLLEETYELLDAVHHGDADQLCEELGDLLLQVLFHSRIAQEAALHAFTIDDVADTLVRKLKNRAPGVLAGAAISLEEQVAQWEAAKTAEKSQKILPARTSVLDDIPTHQPALALAQKVINRVTRAGLPAQLIPASITSISVSADGDAENSLRAAVLEFINNVRDAEDRIASHRQASVVAESNAETALGAINAQEWCAGWAAVSGPR
ncbi:MAG: nucleoside triphosphate pyrophosphohydrolase [Mycobacteriaceae bacterium]|nr:nucleoside triphosphate pyrophosphohydrolase [Mycobacteriaceae bacterium]